MRYFIRFPVLLIFSLSPVLAESPWIELNGLYTIRGKTLHDPPPNEDQTTHISFTILGEAAKKMYQMIDAQPIEDRCGVDHLTKLSGNIKCDYFERDQNYACYFGIGVKDNDIVRGVLC